MAIRMSGVEPEAQRIAEEAVAAIDTYGLIDANAENLQFTLTSRRNPYYRRRRANRGRTCARTPTSRCI